MPSGLTLGKEIFLKKYLPSVLWLTLGKEFFLKNKKSLPSALWLEDPLEAYTNPSVHSRISEYTKVVRSLHGPDHDPSTQDFDGEAVMRAGQGKKHGRFWLGDGVIDTASTPSLSQI